MPFKLFSFCSNASNILFQRLPWHFGGISNSSSWCGRKMISEFQVSSEHQKLCTSVVWLVYYFLKKQFEVFLMCNRLFSVCNANKPLQRSAVYESFNLWVFVAQWPGAQTANQSNIIHIATDSGRTEAGLAFCSDAIWRHKSTRGHYYCVTLVTYER